MLQLLEPVTGTGQSNCKEPPESVEPGSYAVWNDPIVVRNQVGFVRLSQIGVVG